jgi:hypothetical protein
MVVVASPQPLQNIEKLVLSYQPPFGCDFELPDGQIGFSDFLRDFAGAALFAVMTYLSV